MKNLTSDRVGKLYFLAPTKGQKGILVSSNLPKNEPNFWRISALASKMGQIKKKNAHHYFMLIRGKCLYLFLFSPILETRAKILQIFGSFFGRFEDTKIPFWD